MPYLETNDSLLDVIIICGLHYIVSVAYRHGGGEFHA